MTRSRAKRGTPSPEPPTARAPAQHAPASGTERRLDAKPATLTPAPTGYADWLDDVKARIHASRQRAAQSVNAELLSLYWNLGREILDRQSREGWGAKIVDRLAADLKVALPDTRGFSPRNLKYMRRFAQVWPEPAFVQQLLHKLPWFHLCTIIDKLEDAKERDWYVRAAIEHGWSRSVLALQIERKAMQRSGAALTNFSERLPTPSSDLARESLKDPYRLDFLGLGDDAQERMVESALVQHVTKFLLELGAGFAFVGRQRVLDVGGDEFFIDLLFYHLKLRRYVVVELKAGKFVPAHLGQLGFYCTAIDAQVKSDTDEPTIGLLLCKSKNALVAEYALRSTAAPVGIADYQLVESLPKDLDASLPSIARIEEELGGPRQPSTAEPARKAAPPKARTEGGSK